MASCFRGEWCDSRCSATGPSPFGMCYLWTLLSIVGLDEATKESLSATRVAGKGPQIAMMFFAVCLLIQLGGRVRSAVGHRERVEVVGEESL